MDARAFRLVPASAGPYARGTKVVFVVYTAEQLSASALKPKVRVTLPGLVAKTYSTTKQADGGFKVTVTLRQHGAGRHGPVPRDGH